MKGLISSILFTLAVPSFTEILKADTGAKVNKKSLNKIYNPVPEEYRTIEFISATSLSMFGSIYRHKKID